MAWKILFFFFFILFESYIVFNLYPYFKEYKTAFFILQVTPISGIFFLRNYLLSKGQAICAWSVILISATAIVYFSHKTPNVLPWPSERSEIPMGIIQESFFLLLALSFLYLALSPPKSDQTLTEDSL